MKVVRSSASRTGRLYGRKYVTKNPVTTPGIDPGTVRLVAQRLNHYATPNPLLRHIPKEIVLSYK
jgi:hypothetical protein